MTHRDDIQLMTAVRAGAGDAFAILYSRHRLSAEHAARAEADNPSDRDDAVADAFASVFQALRSGKGPDRSFRPYLLTAVRRIAQRKNKQSTRAPVIPVDAQEASMYDEDTLTAAFDSATMVKAFNTLPHRWQLALWYVDIQNTKPAVAAPLLKLSPNAVSALVRRAREGLRHAYIQAHVGPPRDTECSEFSGRLGAHARNALIRSEKEKIQHHLRVCPHCTAVLAHLNDVQAGMTIGPVRQQSRISTSGITFQTKTVIK